MIKWEQVNEPVKVQAEQKPSLRDQLAMAAPHEEVADMFPDDRIGAARFLGVDSWPDDGYVRCLAKARYMWADAMLKERDR